MVVTLEEKESRGKRERGERKSGPRTSSYCKWKEAGGGGHGAEGEDVLVNANNCSTGSMGIRKSWREGS